MGPSCAGLGLCMSLLIAIVQAEAAGRGLAQVDPPAGTMEPGYGLDRDGVKVPCAVGTYNPGGSNMFCLRCGGGWTTKGRGKTSVEDCLIIRGWGWDAANNTPKPCDKGSWSSGGVPKARLALCQACPTGFTTQEQESDSATDCEICIAGHGGPECAICPVNTWSAGGVTTESECTPCEDGSVSSQGSFNVDQCFKAVLEPNFDRLILNDERQWKLNKLAKSEGDCTAACVAASKPSCFMTCWSDNQRKCQALFEYDVGKNSGVMGFRVAGGQDYVLWTAPNSLTAGTRIASLKDLGLKACLDACTANNNCEAFTHPGGAAVGACKLFKSELDADWVTRVHVDGTHLFTNSQVVGGRRQL